MNYVQLLEEVKHEVMRFFYTHENANLVYHNLSHTQSVVANASHIARHYKLNDKDFFIVSTAAWFHDMGYFIEDGSKHEQRGADAATHFLQSKAIDEETIQMVRKCIFATIIPQKPGSLLEQIVCDADLYHFGTTDFAERNKLMRKEAEWRKGNKIPKAIWRKETIAFMEAHHFATDYCVGLLQLKKEENLRKLKEKQAEENEEELTTATSVVAMQPAMESVLPEAAGNKKQKSDRPERGIETMFRISSNNHQRLSDMADNKAHIMVTTTSIIISVLLSVLLRKLEDNPNLVIPTILLLAVCLITMVFSILATRPSLPQGSFTQEDINNRKVNLLFFGNFYRMSYEDYSAGMQKMMNDRDFLYGSLTRDVYSQGIVLGRKYKLLRIAYNVFMFGIVIAVLAFVIASIFFAR